MILNRFSKRCYLVEFLTATFHQKLNLPERLNMIFCNVLARYFNNFEELGEPKMWQFSYPSGF